MKIECIWNESDDRMEVFRGKKENYVLVDTNKDGLADYTLIRNEFLSKFGMVRLEKRVGCNTNDLQQFKDIMKIRDEMKKRGL